MKFFCFEIPSPDCTDVNIPMGVFIQSETQCLNFHLWSEHSRTDLEVGANFKLKFPPQSPNTRRLLALKASSLIGYSLKIHTHTHTHIYI